MHNSNGSEYNDYIWNQSYEEVTCEIKIGQLYKQKVCVDSNLKNINRNSIIVNINTGDISIFINNENIFYKELSLLINHKSSTWYLDNSFNDFERINLIIIMEKKKKGWWSSCFKGDPEIDFSNIISTKNFNECDETTQKEIRKMIHENNNLLNKSNSENDILNIINKSWNEKNSHFQGIKYDSELIKKINKF